MDEENNSANGSDDRAGGAVEPVRSRWTPKPEQILILESIFNSGMVNPPKEETARIRKLLEKFGSVGDANVFYWFQNRRSRSRRRQRQIQASLAATAAVGGCLTERAAAQIYETTAASCSSSCTSSSSNSSGGGGYYYDGHATSMNTPFPSSSSSPSTGFVGSGNADDLFTLSRQMAAGYGDYNPAPYQHGNITVYINGIPSEVPRGPFDMRATFGHDVVLIHSSGVPLPVNEYGMLLQSLQMGESYYLVARPT